MKSVSSIPCHRAASQLAGILLLALSAASCTQQDMEALAAAPAEVRETPTAAEAATPRAAAAGSYLVYVDGQALGYV